MPQIFSVPQDEPELSREECRARGVYYTPPEIAAWIVAETYGPLLEDWNGVGSAPRLLDPACGGGVFLLAARERLEKRRSELGLRNEPQAAAVRSAIHGRDIDTGAIANLRTKWPELPAANLRCADTLRSEEREQYDAIVGNPPYVSIRELARGTPSDYVKRLRDRYCTARGNFDLYAPFWERSLELLRPGGRLGLIVPNKWNTLDYARPLRELLLNQTTIEQIVDVSSVRLFPRASAYPQIVILRKEPPAAEHRLRFRSVHNQPQLAGQHLADEDRGLLQRGLHAGALVLGNDIPVEARVSTRPLGELCELHSGASGYSADRLADALRERADVPSANHDGWARFIVSGNINRYAIHGGLVRFLNRVWQQPCLPLAADCLTEDKRELYREPKLVFSGMCQRLEAAYDERGLALGVQVFAARSCQLEPNYLLGLLNSKLLTYLFRERFGAKRLGGGYLAINKGQLAQLPIPLPCSASSSRTKKIADLARQLSHSYSIAADAQLDALAYEAYGLSAKERRTVEAAFAPASKQRAAA
jgi:tRNA1(Val) A37 N6-methylase TrmN6